MKEFSVLISVYAREQSDYLRSALHSVFEQTVPPTGGTRHKASA